MKKLFDEYRHFLSYPRDMRILLFSNLIYAFVLPVIDVERAGEFLVMAATLMELKSKLLLPRTEEQLAQEEDPRQELVRQLLEYKRFKDAAALLEQQAERQSCRLPRQGGAGTISPG